MRWCQMGKRHWLASAAALAALQLWPAVVCGQQEPVLPGNARQGALLFREKRCIECHSFQAIGGSGAPDLARRSAREYTPNRLAAVMWNHAPAMWGAMAQKGIAVPALGEREAADLYAYFYSVRYFDRPGDAARGKALFATKRCGQCHALRVANLPSGLRWRVGRRSLTRWPGPSRCGTTPKSCCKKCGRHGSPGRS